MDRMQDELRSYYRILLEDTFNTVMRLSQWCFTAPYPLDPYQRLTPFNHRRFFLLWLLKILLSILLFGAFIVSQVALYLLGSSVVYIYAVPMFIKIMYNIQTALQISSMCYVVFVYQFRTNIHRYYFNRICRVLEQFGRNDTDLGLHKVRRTVRILMLLSPLHIGVTIIQTIVFARSWLGYVPKLAGFVITDALAKTIILQYVTILGTVLVLLRQMNDTLESFLLVPVVHVRTVPPRLTVDDQMTIEKIRSLQLSLMRVVMKVNGGEFGILQAMNIVTGFFFTIVSLLQIYQGVGQDPIPVDKIALRTLSTALKFSMFFIIAYPNRLIQKQTLRLYNVLNLLNKANNGPICSNIINRFLTQTSMFFNVHEAYGIIPIDMNLIFKIVGGITSIFVVMVQFIDSFKMNNH